MWEPRLGLKTERSTSAKYESWKTRNYSIWTFQNIKKYSKTPIEQKVTWIWRKLKMSIFVCRNRTFCGRPKIWQWYIQHIMMERRQGFRTKKHLEKAIAELATTIELFSLRAPITRFNVHRWMVWTPYNHPTRLPLVSDCGFGLATIDFPVRWHSKFIVATIWPTEVREQILSFLKHPKF